MAEKVYLGEIEFNSKHVKKRSKNLLSELDELDDEVSLLPSSLYSKTKDEKKKDKKEKKEKEKSELDIDDDWMTTLTNFKAPKAKKKSKSFFDGFDLGDGKKGKKKKKKEGSQNVNHKKDFEPEMALLRNLQIEQSKFVDSLQKKYNQMEDTKSTARGVGKYTTDLINSITSARSTSLQIVDKIIATKKTIADLDFKERKEFGGNSNSEQQNLTNYASTYLKQVMSVGRNNIVGQQSSYSNFEDDYDNSTDDLFASIDQSLGDTERDDDVEKYLKYENDDVKITVMWNDDAPDDSDDKYYFVAHDKYGKEVDDYPLPEKTKMNINRATATATDLYGNKYKLVVV